MNDKQLSSFVLVAQEGSFSKAAERAFLSVPSLKKQMDMLESELQVCLLVRSNRGVQLTEQGKKFLAFAKNTLAEWQNVKNQLSPQVKEETIRIAYNSDHTRDFIYYRALKPFKDRYPNVKVMLEETESFDPQNCDLFLGHCNEADEMIGKYPLGDFPIHCIINKKNTLSERRVLMVEDLSGMEVLIPPAYICSRIRPDLVKKLKSGGVARVMENRRNGSFYTINVYVSDGISIIAGKEKELPDTVCQIPLNGFFYDYNIFYSKRSIGRPIIREYIHFLQVTYQEILTEFKEYRERP